METVRLEVQSNSWYAHAERGGMRWRYWGGSYVLIWNSKRKSKIIDPHKEGFMSESTFIVKALEEAIKLLKYPCIVELDVSYNSYLTPWIEKQVNMGKFLSGNNRYSHSGDLGEFFEIVDKMGHILKLSEPKDISVFLQEHLKNNNQAEQVVAIEPEKFNKLLIKLQREVTPEGTYWYGKNVNGNIFKGKYEYGILEISVEGGTGYYGEHGDEFDSVLSTEDMLYYSGFEITHSIDELKYQR